MKIFLYFLFFLSGVLSLPNGVVAQNIISQITSAPIHPNGIVWGFRLGINILLQSEEAQGNAFLNPEIIGYGIPPGGRVEVEMLEGFERDPQVPLDENSIILVAGTPQQGLPARVAGYTVGEGANPNTFIITPESAEGLVAENLLSPAPGAAFDPIRQRGIKIIHVGRARAFVSRGETGRVAVRIFDTEGSISASGEAEVKFLPSPRQMVFPTNIPHDQRNHNWQRVKVGQIVGASNMTLPLPLMLYDRNSSGGTDGINGAGVLSLQQVEELGFPIPASINRYSAGLILQDRDGDGLLNPVSDIILGGMSVEAPEGSSGFQVVTPLVSERMFLSVATARYNERAGETVGGSIMQVVFIAGDKPGLYNIRFALLENAGDVDAPDGSVFSYTVVVEE